MLLSAAVTELLSASTRMPRYGWDAALPCSRSAIARLARSIGMAKPMPALAFVPVTLGSAICALIATTLP